MARERADAAAGVAAPTDGRGGGDAARNPRPAPRWRRWLWRALAAFLLLHVLAVAGLVWGQHFLVYHPMSDVRHTPAEAGLAYEDVTLTTRDGERLAAWWIPATGASRGTILYIHGNAGNLGHRVRIAAMLHTLGVDLLLFDFRGFGRSTGRPTERGTYLDAAAAWAHLTRERGVAPERIVIYGRSLGGPIAAHLAAEVDAAGLVLDSTFESIPRLVQDTYPRVLYMPAFIRFAYPTASYLAGVDEPVLVAHAPGDGVVPYAHGRALLARARDGTWLELRGHHGDGPFATGAAYLRGLDAFLTRVLGPARG